MSSFTIKHDAFLDAASAYVTGVDRQPGYWAGKQPEPRFLNRIPEGGYTAPQPPAPVVVPVVTPPPLPTGLLARYRRMASVATLYLILNPTKRFVVRLVSLIVLVSMVAGVVLKTATF